MIFSFSWSIYYGCYLFFLLIIVSSIYIVYVWEKTLLNNAMILSDWPNRVEWYGNKSWILLLFSFSLLFFSFFVLF